MGAQKKPQGRKAAGAPPNAGYQHSRRVSLDDETVRTMCQLSGGNLSAGIRKAAEIVRLIKAGTLD